MTNEATTAVPDGFIEMPKDLGFNDVLAPFYRKIEGDSVSFGLRVNDSHTNMIGICHGGVIMTLVDVAAAAAVNIARGKFGGSPTINISFDFIATSKAGDWIQVDVQRTDIKKRFGFSSGVVNGPRGCVARFNGTFYLPEHSLGNKKLEDYAKLYNLGTGASDSA